MRKEKAKCKKKKEEQLNWYKSLFMKKKYKNKH